MRPIEIAGRKVGPGCDCLVVAEAGVNHNGDLELAKRLVDAAARAGADAVKFQSFHAEQVASAKAPKAAYQRASTDATQSQLDMLRGLQLSADDHRAIQRHCRERGIVFLSTPFDRQSVDLLVDLELDALKLSSGEITNWPFLAYAAATKKPLILSSGMAHLSEVDEAVRVVRQAGCQQLILLHCVSCYPADPAVVNLRAMQTMAERLGVPVGYSDHTLGVAVPLAAAALGACLIEKHFTLDRRLPGPDHAASAEPDELRALVSGVRTVHSALGDGIKRPARVEEDNRRIVRRSLAAARSLCVGTVLEPHHLIAVRPAVGIAPNRLAEVVGRTVRTPIEAGEPIGERHLA